jgi:hypothetical protein
MASDSEDEERTKLKLLVADDDDLKSHFNFKDFVQDSADKGLKKKAKNEIEDNFKFNAEDNRFSAIFSSHHYHVDPSDPHFKKTKAMEELMDHNKRRVSAPTTEAKDRTREKASELSTLIRSVKAKTKNFSQKKKGK